MGNFDFDSMLGHDIPCTCGRTHSTDVQKIYLGSDAIDESDGHTTVFPIPADVRALNSNMTQTPGY